jgi:hypothetical protein
MADDWISRTLEESLTRQDRMVSEMEEARVAGRDSIYRVALLSATIVGFSATLLSIKSVSERVDLSLLRASWFLFASVVALGPVLIYLEAKAKYAISWRALQQMNFDPRTLSFWDGVKFQAVLAYTVVVRPRNLIYASDTDFDDEETGAKAAWLNARMIQKLHVVLDAAVAMEIIFWPLFIAALVVLVLAVAP